MDQEEELLKVEDGPRVLGIGLGLFFLILLWSFAFVAILAFSRYSSITSILVLVASAFITIIALALPRYPPFEKVTDEVEPKRIYDTPFIWYSILNFTALFYPIQNRGKIQNNETEPSCKVKSLIVEIVVSCFLS